MHRLDRGADTTVRGGWHGRPSTGGGPVAAPGRLTVGTRIDAAATAPPRCSAARVCPGCLGLDARGMRSSKGGHRPLALLMTLERQLDKPADQILIGHVGTSPEAS